jgi:hypothetical protein
MAGALNGPFVVLLQEDRVDRDRRALLRQIIAPRAV